ncbi:MAG: PDZ domain-containing protein [Burkholderiaceae bacterium]
MQAQIVEHGEVRHARLGVMIQQVNQKLAESFGLAAPEGALVADVVPGGPADKAGIKVGDVIQQVGDRKITLSGDLPSIVSMSEPGVRLTVRLA